MLYFFIAIESRSKSGPMSELIKLTTVNNDKTQKAHALKNISPSYFSRNLFSNIDLIICLVLDPASWATSEQELPGLVIAEDEDGEWDGGQPPVDLERVHPQALVHAWGVGKEGSKDGLENEAKVHGVILHALLEYGVLPRLTDDEIGPLYNHDGDEEGSVASILKNLTVSICPLLTI